jgi:hypothetical protein
VAITKHAHKGVGRIVILLPNLVANMHGGKRISKKTVCFLFQRVVARSTSDVHLPRGTHGKTEFSILSRKLKSHYGARNRFQEPSLELSSQLSSQFVRIYLAYASLRRVLIRQNLYSLQSILVHSHKILFKISNDGYNL